MERQWMFGERPVLQVGKREEKEEEAGGERELPERHR